MTTTRLSALLLMAVFCIINLARAQDVAPTSALAGRHFETGEPLPWFSLPATGGFAGGPADMAQPGPWTIKLVGRLAKHPELNRRQLQILLEAISLSSSEFFAASANTTIRVKADDAVQGLRQRALAAFTKNEVSSLFDYAATQQSEQEIVRKYYDLSSLPLKGRRAAFKIASAGDKCGLWRTHLAFSLINHPEFNEWQKEIILAGMLVATPEYFDVPSNSPDWKLKVREPSRALERQIAVAFSREDAASIFATLGDNIEAAKRGPTNASPAFLTSINHKTFSDSSSYRQWTVSRYSSQDIELEQQAGPCQCSTSSDYCPIWGSCRSGVCQTQGGGCGTFWSYPCNGVCR
jgi:hypothetical protein